MKLEVGVAQIPFSSVRQNPIEDMMRRVRAQLETRPVDLLVLPELWTSNPFNSRALLDWSYPSPQKLTAELDEHFPLGNEEVVFGTFPIWESGKLLNKVAFRSKSGVWQTEVSKTFPFGFGEGESQVVSPGFSRNLLETRFGPVGILVCFDLRFSRLIYQMGTIPPILVVTASWPKSRLDHWLVLLRSRAIEYQSFVVGCNSSGEIGGQAMAGNSRIFGPDGRLIMELNEDDFLGTCEIDLSEVHELRRNFPIERLRLNDLRSLSKRMIEETR